MSSKLRKIPKSKIYNLSYLVLAVLILLSIGITYIFYTSSRNKDIARFTNESKRLKSAIENRVNLYIALLKGTRGFVEASTEMNNEKFSKYVNSLDLENNYTGVQGIGFTQSFIGEEKAAFENKIRAEGVAGFRVFPESSSSERQAIVYLFPLTEMNQRALGFDMSTEENRRIALERARDTGKPVATGKVRLIQEKDEDAQEGFLIYLPIYKNNQTPELFQKRISDLRGYVYSPFRARNFLNEIYDNSRDKDIAIRLYDNEILPQNLLAETQHSEIEAYTRFGNETYITREIVEVAGRQWIVEFYTLPSFGEQSNIVWTPLIFFCGICFSFLLFGMTYWEAISREKLQNYASDLYDLQAEREILFENESKARKIAEEANSAKDEFIAIVSHELKTPLNTIAGWTRIIKSDDISKQTRDLALSKIDKNLRLQAKLVEQLLTYSEIISKNTDFREDKVDFQKLVEEIFEENKSVAEENEIILSKESDAEKAFVSGDAEKLKTVINNLFSNALKFTPKGGKIKVKVSHKNGLVCFEIKDNGRGIDSEFLPYIFESYKQADTPNTREYGGLGLGLAISKHILNLHNGTIEVNSKGRGEGSEFTVKLPLMNDLTK
ncbi:MAG: CHASE domain-containing protein [Pyrinomonadaceae bacterium]|nr:CHASE domain-containing protein [Pyrinomonadaceae bacterium]